MAKKSKKPVIPKQNPVAKNANKFNKSQVFRDRKKDAKNDNYGETT